MLDALISMLDWLWLDLIVPVMSMVGEGLYRISIGAFSSLGIPISFSIFLIGILTSIVSLIIRVILKVDMRERVFQKKIQRKRELQEGISGIEDWKVQEVLTKATDEEIDEVYNTYLSYKFAWFGTTYLVPIFLVLYWLDTIPELNGVRFVVEFPPNPLGLPGLSVALTFFLGYLPGIFLLTKLKAVRLEKERAKRAKRVLAG